MIRAAELGHTYPMNELGYIFTYGKGVPADVSGECGITSPGPRGKTSTR